MSLDVEEDHLFASGGGSHFLSPSPNKHAHARKSPSKQRGMTMKAQRSSASLRAGTGFDGSPLELELGLGDDDENENENEGGDGMHSLAHELAAALMPAPSAGQLLADELGLEFDEGAEGIDEQQAADSDDTLAEQLGGHGREMHGSSSFDEESPSDELARHFGSSAHASADSPAPGTNRRGRLPPPPPQQQQQQQKSRSPPAQDPLDVISRNMQSTESLLSSLRRLDSDIVAAASGTNTSAQPAFEKAAADIIRRINETVRDREGQVRELMEYEREFRKIQQEVGGNDVLSRLDEVEDLLLDSSSSSSSTLNASQSSVKSMDTDHEPNGRANIRQSTSDWEINPDHNHLGDEDASSDVEPDPESPSPMKDVFSTPIISGPPTAANTVPLLSNMRSVNSALAASLNILSEQAQMNGAANSDAGRKIRALKNKLGGWRAEWDSAEKSRLRIERWEAGLPDDASTPATSFSKRVDGRSIVQEQLEAFKAVLADAGMKTQAIMARS